jgi:hypothetical protein
VLLPPSPVDWLPANHLVFFLLDLAAELDLEPQPVLTASARTPVTDFESALARV